VGNQFLSFIFALFALTVNWSGLSRLSRKQR